MGIKSFLFRKNADKRIYLERRNIRRLAYMGITSLLLVALIGTLLILMHNISFHIDQSVRFGYIINNYIKANTLAELKQYDMKLINNDLWSSAISLSALNSDKEKVIDIYDGIYQDFLVNGPIFYYENSDLVQMELVDG